MKICEDGAVICLRLWIVTGDVQETLDGDIFAVLTVVLILTAV